jgi:hypothetical protein
MRESSFSFRGARVGARRGKEDGGSAPVGLVRRSLLKKRASSGRAHLRPILLRLTAILLDIADSEAKAKPALDEEEDHDDEAQDHAD